MEDPITTDTTMTTTMMYPHSHKTVFVLDRNPFFFRPSNEIIEVDIFAKQRGNAANSIPPIMKSMWTSNVEAVIEYCRIVFDIHTCDKLISIIISDTEAYALNDWSTKDQNIAKLMQALAKELPQFQGNSDAYCEPGLKAAVKAISESTQFQKDLDTTDFLNNGRIVLLTTLSNNDDIDMLHAIIKKEITTLSEKLNESSTVENRANLLPIDNIDLVILNIAQKGSGINFNSPQCVVNTYLSSICLDAFSGTDTSNKLVEICMHHFNLASTIVTGIPMKEEQNASSSANYDVELLHHRDAHYESSLPPPPDTPLDTPPPASATTTDADADSPTSSKQASGGGGVLVEVGSKVGRQYLDEKFQSATLKWCTPRGNAIDALQCVGAFRISPVDVNSRPSSCLTNFLLNGRSVMLEQSSISRHGCKVISHALISHGGEIYIHSLAVKRTQLEDSPSISEGHGGRVTDYRIKDFADFMTYNLMAPASVIQDGGREIKDPIERAKEQLERMTRIWPLVLSGTILYNVKGLVSKMLEVITHEKISDADFRDSQKSIYDVVSMESRKENLPLRNNLPSSKREEQYTQFWNELEKYLRCFKTQSVKHNNLHQCVEECKRTAVEGDDTTGMFDHSSESDAAEDDKKTESPITVKVDEHASPMKKMKYTIDRSKVKKGTISLLGLYNNSLLKAMTSRDDFQGRIDSTDSVAKLYIDLEDRFNGIKDPRTKEIGNTLSNKISQIRNGYKKILSNSSSKK